MHVDLDMTDLASPRTFAAALADVALDEPVTVRLSGDEVCPSRIVPVFALADGALRLAVGELAESLGTRDSAERLRHIAENAIDNDGRRIQLDFAGVASCSSAFADELIGKMVAKYGLVGFMERVALRNLGGLAAMLINSTLAQRLANEGRTAT